MTVAKRESEKGNEGGTKQGWGLKLIYIKYRNKRKKKDSQRGGKVKRSKSLVQLRLMSGHKSLDGTQTEKYQEENFTNLGFDKRF